mmetsp:Transcript_11728/g.30081  ORF Transcript_11728/g.30081 Transcript_11728/m.30081 type:complete len:280 (-) Transcript_11728:70-909(-)
MGSGVAGRSSDGSMPFKPLPTIDDHTDGSYSDEPLRTYIVSSDPHASSLLPPARTTLSSSGAFQEVSTRQGSPSSSARKQATSSGNGLVHAKTRNEWLVSTARRRRSCSSGPKSKLLAKATVTRASGSACHSSGSAQSAHMKATRLATSSDSLPSAASASCTRLSPSSTPNEWSHPNSRAACKTAVPSPEPRSTNLSVSLSLMRRAKVRKPPRVISPYVHASGPPTPFIRSSSSLVVQKRPCFTACWISSRHCKQRPFAPAACLAQTLRLHSRHARLDD